MTVLWTLEVTFLEMPAFAFKSRGFCFGLYWFLKLTFFSNAWFDM